MPKRNELLSLSDRAQTKMAQHFNCTYHNRVGSVLRSPILTNSIEAQGLLDPTAATVPTQAWTIHRLRLGCLRHSVSCDPATLAVG